MATMRNITPPTASDVPKKERWLIARLDGLGFDVDMLDNDAECFFIIFMVGESHRCRRMADQIKLRFSYLFHLWITERFRGQAFSLGGSRVSSSTQRENRGHWKNR